MGYFPSFNQLPRVGTASHAWALRFTNLPIRRVVLQAIRLEPIGSLLGPCSAVKLPRPLPDKTSTFDFHGRSHLISPGFFGHPGRVRIQ